MYICNESGPDPPIGIQLLPIGFGSGVEKGNNLISISCGDRGFNLNNKMYYRRDLTNARKNHFNKLGITDEGDMLRILNFFDAIAEIGYRSFKNKQSNSVAV